MCNSFIESLSALYHYGRNRHSYSCESRGVCFASALAESNSGMLFHGADALSPTGRRWTFTFSLCAEFLRNRLTLYIAQKWKNSG